MVESPYHFLFCLRIPDKSKGLLLRKRFCKIKTLDVINPAAFYKRLLLGILHSLRKNLEPHLVKNS